MRTRFIAIAVTLAGAAAIASADAIPQSTSARVDAHVSAAKAAAGTDFAGVFNRICTEAVPPSTPAAPRAPASRPAGPPPRADWHAEPVKVFDNLYFLGQTEYSVWAVTTSAGIILIDSIFDYSVDDEVVGGLKTLGLDPRRSSTSWSATATPITQAEPGTCRTSSTPASF